MMGVTVWIFIMAHKTIFCNKKNGMTTYDIADKLGITPQGVRLIIHSSLKKMRRYCVQHGIELSSLLIEDKDADDQPFKLPPQDRAWLS
jgi:hypothetical protein